MRAFAACLTVFLGLGAMTTLGATMAGCSDTSDAGSGGASGSVATAGSGGASAGAGGASCSFASAACLSCLSTKCMDEFAACQSDSDCKAAQAKLTPCACGGTDIDTCAGKFVTDGGDPARDFAECYTLNCEAACM
jgi:hypothetical protein